MEHAAKTISRDSILVDFALQGGGSHGAFTWGVLDRFLEEPWLEIDGVSGTSAGAMNSAVLAAGYAKGGAQGAREALENFWRGVSDAARFSPLQRGPLDILLGRWTMDNSPVYLMADMMSRVISPYTLSAAGKNPLRDILNEFIDFELIAKSPINVFVTATNVHTGRGRIFRNDSITPEVLLASACLPSMFQAVEIEGDHYWDGGYSGNPTLTPLVRHCKADDMILIPINPVERAETPRTASEIMNRLNEISFNAVALKELRMIAMLRKVVDAGDSEGAEWAKLRLHRVGNDVMNTLGASSKMITEWAFLTMLRDEGRKSAQAFLDAHAMDLGKKSTMDIDVLLEGV